MWKDLSLPWQGCFEEGWEAYCMGSLPIGAVLTDLEGHILARGRNRIFEGEADGQQLAGHRLAHAEMNTLLRADWKNINPKSSILYTTTEPCPLCVGAIRMMRLGEVRYASQDPGAGSADLFQANGFLRNGNIKVVGPEVAELEAILVALLVEMILHDNAGKVPAWIELHDQLVPGGAWLGKQLFASKQLRSWKDERLPANVVYDRLVEYL